MSILRKIPTILGAGGGGGLLKYWKKVSYITNDNLAYANIGLLAGDYLEIVCNKIQDVENGKELIGDSYINTHFYGHLRVENNKLSFYAYSSSYYVFETALSEINLIKMHRTAVNTVEVTINNSENSTLNSGYNVNQDAQIGIYHNNHVSGKISNFEIQNITYHRNGETYLYEPVKCIKAYDTYTVGLVGWICFDNGNVIKSATADNFVAHE